MKKNILILATLTVAVTVAFIARRSFQSQPSDSSQANTITIGIIQTISHPALDLAQQGFKDELTKELGAEVTFVEQNAHGSASQAHMIAQSFKSNSTIKGIFTIASTATQAASATEKNKPLFFAAVTNPDDLGLTRPNTNACGASDMIDIAKTVNLVVTLLPKAHTIALLYNPGEANSTLLVEKLKKAFIKLGKQVVEAGINTANEVRSATMMAVQNADVVLAPTDNTVATALPTITQITSKASKPLIVCDNLLVTQGALASCGVDYLEQGKLAAQCALQVLKHGKTPETIGVAQSTCNSIVINKKVLHELTITVPKSMADVATLV